MAFMKRMSLGRFSRLVRKVLDSLPLELKQHLDNVVVDVQEEPDLETLRHLDFTEEEIAGGDSLYGLFDPLPLPDTSGLEFDQLPHRIIIYKRPLEEDFPRAIELREEIRKTVIHELAHHFGYSERDIDKWTNVS
jgi:predicted Zn-dependent protease with MMP-like domain